MPTDQSKVPLTPEQKAAIMKLVNARGQSFARFMRDAVRYYMKEIFNEELPPDAPVGGARKPGVDRDEKIGNAQL